jgi:intracellular sulfur oxidation DsrE/DsrF family protein
MSDASTPRRGFLGRLSIAFLGLAGTPVLAARTSDPDESWLKGLNGQHRQFFDVGTMRDGRPMGRVLNFLDAYHDAYGTTDGDTNVVFGAHSGALGIVMSDALWTKYEIGKRNSQNDPLTKMPAVRNPFIRREVGYDWSRDYSVTKLQERGVRFIACRRSIRALAMELTADGKNADAINDEIIAGLLPGVVPVPAMVVAINRAHEAGLAYVFAG